MSIILRSKETTFVGNPALKSRLPAISKRTVEYDVHSNSTMVVITYGKRLVQGELTIEGRARVAQVLKILYSSFAQGMECSLIFSGYQGEAEAMAEFLYDLSAAQALPPHQIFLETRACNTFENAIFSVQLLQRNGIHPGWLFLVSSDYHLNEMSKVDQLLPNESELFPYRQYLPHAQILLSSAQYPYRLSDPESTLNVNFHLLTHSFRPLSVMLHALAKLSVTEIHPEIITHSLKTYGQLTKMATNSSLLMSEPILDTWSQNQYLLGSNLRAMATIATDSQQITWDWKSTARLTNYAINQLRWVSDPDQLNRQ